MPVRTRVCCMPGGRRARPGLRRLVELGIVETTATDAPRADSPLRVPAVMWDAVRGEAPGALAPWARHRAVDTLARLDELLLAASTLDVVRRAPAVLAGGDAASALVVRGPASGGRRTVLGAIARCAGWGALEISGLAADDARWRQVGPLSTLLDAMPIAVLDVAPGDLFEIPALDGWDGPIGVVIGRRGGVTGAPVERAVTLVLGLPDVTERARHWTAALGHSCAAGDLAARFRMTGGNIRRTAALARAEAALAGRDRPSATDISLGARALHGRLLESFASRVTTETDWAGVAVRPDTMRELRLLEARCRHRDRIGGTLGIAATAAPTAGVRALLTGPSGTGKTLAARTLAGVLGIDLYRVDLSTRRQQVPRRDREEPRPAVLAAPRRPTSALLLDEGDALMTRRTDVHTSNDRYANLETNFLLQRLESFEGILLVTTNAGERIDDAFRRRMDVVVDFGLPDESERWSIWQPAPAARARRSTTTLLDELAHALRAHRRPDPQRGAARRRCSRSRTGAHSAPTQLEAAVRREYVKSGEVCPLAAEVRVG